MEDQAECTIDREDAPLLETACTSPDQAHIEITELFKKHHRNLLRFVKRYIRNQEDAEDVVQGAFLEAHRCADRFSGLSKPSTWLFGIAYNLARNQVRRNIEMRYDEIDEELIEQIVDLHEDPEDTVDLKLRVGKIYAAFSKMPPKLQDMFESIVDGESTYEETAKRLRVPIGTVRSRVSRVRAKMRDLF